MGGPRGVRAHTPRPAPSRKISSQTANPINFAILPVKPLTGGNENANGHVEPGPGTRLSYVLRNYHGRYLLQNA